ncbi:MAG TPA: nitroreductase family protein [Stellaceae bacterium]|nr:nitroreductase family protein [Stellaceae bacterium]
MITASTSSTPGAGGTPDRQGSLDGTEEEEPARARPWYELVSGRRSIRRYGPAPVPAAVLRRILTAACWAPSAHNRQPWRFAVLTAFAEKDRLSRAMGERLRADRLADGDPREAVERDVARSYARITEAPCVIIIALDMADMDRYPDKRQRAEHMMAVQSTAMATQNLLLAAHAEGLGACWMCAPLFCPQTVAEALDLPKGWQPQALVTLGAPAEPGKPPSRRALENVLWRPDRG